MNMTKKCLALSSLIEIVKELIDVFVMSTKERCLYVPK